MTFDCLSVWVVLRERVPLLWGVSLRGIPLATGCIHMGDAHVKEAVPERAFLRSHLAMYEGMQQLRGFTLTNTLRLLECNMRLTR